MTLIESTVTVNKPIQDVYSFLSDLNNHQQLMPENIYNWSSSTDEARFTVQNMAKLTLKVSSRTENEAIIISPIEKPPFDVELRWTLQEQNGATVATYTIAADLNMMMKMLAQGPLQKLANHETQRLQIVLA